MLGTILGGVVILAVIIILVLLWKSKTAKAKLNGGEKLSSVEGIAHSFQHKLEKELNLVRKGVRTVESLRDMVTEELNQIEERATIQFKNYVTSIVSTEKHFEKLKNSQKESLKLVISKAKSFKKAYLTSNKESDKLESEKYLTKVIMLEKQIQVSEEHLIKWSEKKESAANSFDMLLCDLSIRRSDVMTKIYSINSEELGINDFVNFNPLEGLLREFDSRLTETQIKKEVDSIVNTSQGVNNNTSISIPEVDETEIKSRFDNL